MLLYELYPFSQGELQGKKETFLENAFAENPHFRSSHFTKNELMDRMIKGGYPEVQKLQNHEERSEWALFFEQEGW